MVDTPRRKPKEDAARVVPFPTRDRVDNPPPDNIPATEAMLLPLDE